MRKQLLLGIALLAATLSFAQKITLPVTYYNTKWKEVKSKNDASYYRESYLENDTLNVTDYYINGAKQMIGQFSDRKGKIKNGFFIYYNEKGLKEGEGYYKENKTEGKWMFFFESGQIEMSGDYVHNKREGDWLLYNLNGTIREKWTYEKDKIIKVKTLKDGVELTENDTFTFADQMPEFEGGQGAMNQFLNRNLSYPPNARKKAIEGRVVLQFIINKDGTITDVNVIKSLDPEIDAEAIRVVKLMPKWMPGKQDGKIVYVRYTLPFVFKLN